MEVYMPCRMVSTIAATAMVGIFVRLSLASGDSAAVVAGEAAISHLICGQPRLDEPLLSQFTHWEPSLLGSVLRASIFTGRSVLQLM
ncbi:hypothetical protein RGR602_PB00341 (plasmid) [Rhizobium gallicum bv. gallicum R602sp]|uniref:Uncharacterized protein n=1 Tax=Rhizobium gallicum bv. gallicum R602sp TaxID=1041138 RepID=A0A0B4XB90_9HYPH|nr:hypothetical protein RGR602_PB00341 [Rhizobium gallicum bv. gallicum R602sp]